MKAIPVSILLLFASSSVFAWCGSCAGPNYTWGTPSCGFYEQGPCCIYDNKCECTDPGRYYNSCISRCEYCEAFGNIGAR